MESLYLCRADYVQIYDGVRGTERWNSTGRFCSRSQQGRVIVSSGSLMRVKFKTDGSVTRQGFSAVVRAGKCV